MPSIKRYSISRVSFTDPRELPTNIPSRSIKWAQTVGDDFELTVQKEPNKLVIKILTATKELIQERFQIRLSDDEGIKALIDLLKPYFTITNQAGRNGTSSEIPAPPLSSAPKRKIGPANIARNTTAAPAPAAKKAKAVPPSKTLKRFSSSTQRPAPKPSVSKIKSVTLDPESGDGSIQLGKQENSDQSSELRKSLLRGYNRKRTNDPAESPAPSEGNPLQDHGYSQLPLGENSYSAGESGNSSEPLPVGVGLKDYVPYSDADAFAQTDIWQEYVTQLPLIEQSSDQTTTWHSAVQDIPIVQSTQPPPAHAFISSSPTGNRDLEAASSMLPLITLSPDCSNILVDLHDSPGSIPSLTKSGPPGVWATEAGDSASMEKNLLHLGIPWFSGEVKDVGDPEPELNMRFPPLSTQQVVNSGIKEQEDEFDEPTILDRYSHVQARAPYQPLMQEDEPTYEQPDRPVRDFPADINSVYGLDEDNLKVLLRDLLLDKDFGTTVDELTDDLAMRRENTNALPHHPVFDGLEPSQLEILMNEEMVERGFEGLCEKITSIVVRLSSPTEDDFQDCYPQADDDGAGQAQQCRSAEGETHYSDSAYQDYPTQYKLPNDNEYDEFEGF